MSTIDQIYQVFLNSTGVNTDTRTIQEGQLFVALKGDNFNGNLYAQKAFDLGAKAVVVDEEDKVINDRCFLVDDTLVALQKLALHHRRTLDIPVIGITGSNGKTTTKELMHAVLAVNKNVLATKGNLNNHIGVPLTVLSIGSDVDIAIIEMGANKPGDIKELCEIAEPDFGMITNIGGAHLEGFGSLEGVARTKSELYYWLLNNGGEVFVNSEDDLLVRMVSRFKSSHNYLGIDSELALSTVSLEPYLNYKCEESIGTTKLIGDYNLANVGAALRIGNRFGVSVEDGMKAIAEYEPSNNRSQVEKKGGYTFILDAYNANPASMAVALKSFESYKANSKVAILGDMLELGQYSRDEHIKVLATVTQLGLSYIICFGEEFYNVREGFESVHFFTDKAKMETAFKDECPKESTVLVKGSRGMRLEDVLGWV